MLRSPQRVQSKKFMLSIVLAAPKNAEALSSWVTGPVFSIFSAETGPISFELIGSLWRDFSRTRFE
jgi:hypothetical protein